MLRTSGSSCKGSAQPGFSVIMLQQPQQFPCGHRYANEKHGTLARAGARRAATSSPQAPQKLRNCHIGDGGNRKLQQDPKMASLQKEKGYCIAHITACSSLVLHDNADSQRWPASMAHAGEQGARSARSASLHGTPNCDCVRRSFAHKTSVEATR